MGTENSCLASDDDAAIVSFLSQYLFVQVDSVATTLSLAEQNHAEELKRVCLEFVSRNLQAVMVSEGYQHMVSSCPQLQVRGCCPLSPILHHFRTTNGYS